MSRRCRRHVLGSGRVDSPRGGGGYDRVERVRTRGGCDDESARNEPCVSVVLRHIMVMTTGCVVVPGEEPVGSTAGMLVMAEPEADALVGDPGTGPMSFGSETLRPRVGRVHGARRWRSPRVARLLVRHPEASRTGAVRDLESVPRLPCVHLRQQHAAGSVPQGVRRGLLPLRQSGGSLTWRRNER